MKLALLALFLVAFVARGRPSGGSLYCIRGSNWNGNKCACEQGFVNLNGKCVCDYGYQLVGSGCQKCASDGTSQICQGSASSCPSGFAWNGYLCAFNWKISNCGPAGYWNGVACSKWTSPIICDAGFSWTGQACSVATALTCAAGLYWNGKLCTVFKQLPVCPSSYVWDASTSCCISNFPQTCKVGQFWDGDSCEIKTTTQRCNPGNYYDGQNCVALAKTVVPVCASNYFWAGTACKATANRTCDANYYLDSIAGYCLLKVCQNNETFSATTSICISAAENTINVKTATASVTAPLAGSGPINITTNNPAGITNYVVNGNGATVKQGVDRSTITGPPKFPTNPRSTGANTPRPWQPVPPVSTTTQGTIGGRPDPQKPVEQAVPPISPGSSRPVQANNVPASVGGVAVSGPGFVSVAAPGTVVVNNATVGQTGPAASSGASQTTTIVTPPPQNPPATTTTGSGTSNKGPQITQSQPNNGNALAIGGNAFSSGNGVGIGGMGIGISGDTVAVSPGGVSAFGNNVPNSSLLNAKLDAIGTLTDLGLASGAATCNGNKC